MRRASTHSSNDNGTSLSPRDRLSGSHQHVHGPWNRKSITRILSQQQNHQCYGSRDGSPTSLSSQDPPFEAAANGAAMGNGPMSPTTHSNTNSNSAQPSYTLWDLVSVGVGGTVGSGIFVLTGYINNHYAGPATCLSFAVSGLAALCSGISFAEFSARLPRIEGSTYTYAYVSMGEYAAVLAASCLTLEYGVSGAAVARSWGDKVYEWMATVGIGDAESVDHAGEKEAFFNPLAGLISLASVVVLACGVQESKRVTNFFTVTKMLLVAFMIVGGFCLFRAENLNPLVVPAQASADGVPAFGVSGILRGATSSFFGYLGFDEVVCLAAEAKNPSDTPRAVLWTLAVVTVVYILASIALSGMLPYQEVSDTSGFPNAFADREIPWAANLTALGEVFTLPVVVLISLLAQPRLCAAMARDGLLPAIFALKTEKDGNLLWSNLLCGIPMTLLATFVPFSWMDDAISVGILFAFNMTNTALIVMRCSGPAAATHHHVNNNSTHHPMSDSLRDGVLPTDRDVVVAIDEVNGIVSSSYPTTVSPGTGRWSLPTHLCGYHFLALMAGLTSHWTVTTNLEGEDGDVRVVSSPWWSAQIGAAGVVLVYAIWLHKRFPAGDGFGDATGDATGLHHSHDSNANFGSDLGDGCDADEGVGHHREPTAKIVFEVPICPFLPLVGVYLNWYLISQLEWSGMVLLLAFLVIISVLYSSCISGSQARSPMDGTPPQRYSPVLNPTDTTATTTTDGPILLRELSLPKRTTT